MPRIALKLGVKLGDMADFEESKSKSRFAELRDKEEEELAEIMAKKRGLPYLDLTSITIDLDSLKLISERDARDGKIVAFQSVGKKVSVALVNPEILKAKQIIEDLKGKRFIVELFLVSPKSLEKAFSRYAELPAFEEIKSAMVAVSQKRLDEFQTKVKKISDLKTLLLGIGETEETRKVSEVLEMIIAGALALDASDIHVEPAEVNVVVRYRMDGVLQEAVSFPQKIYKLLLSRVKLISELKLNVKDKAQDGRFTIRTKDTDIEVRTATLPGPNGEAVTLRILHPKTIALKLEDLGMNPQFYAIIQKQLDKPNGMILTTGPTGSGKTTTLYAFVKTVNEPGLEIITIEDPIEYHLPSVTQTQVDPEKGYDFSNGLRAILRQDPDIILVGEIRDFETAEIAMHAALTGHLVFSTLHTNDAPGTVPRLIDMGVKPNIIAPAINIAMAQRLVRKLCKACKKKTEASPEDIKKIKAEMEKFPKGIEKPDLGKAEFFAVVGCDACGGTGYKGRIGVFEGFEIDDAIERLILTEPSESALREAAIKQGMLTMKQDGIIKLLSGVTTLEELERVIGS
uniref:Type IV pilus assembly protein PilB, type IV pilus assembly protein PilB n=2 Tax=Parcubacteria group TaxID=1794811 RepID=A0A0H4T755_9BACT|nr:type IV pilus assembly protein PilB, type IV pilus assembly protein PilB [uncultured Parcubacteria bacterium Rifle_16ft_4_minimus_37658]